MRTFWLAFAALAGTALAAALPTLGFALAALRGAYEEQARRDLDARAEMLAHFLRDRAAPAGTAEAAAPAGGGRDWPAVLRAAAPASAVRYTLIAPDGRVLADTREDPARMDRHADRPEVAAALAGRPGAEIRDSATMGARLMYVARPAGPAPGLVVRASMSMAALDARLAVWRRRLAFCAAAMAAAAVLLAGILSRRFGAPLERIAAGAGQFAAGRLGHRVAAAGTRETRAVAQALNRMARELAARLDTIEAQRGELAAVLSGMDEGVLSLGVDRTLASANRAAAELLGLPAPSPAGRPLAAVCRHTELLEFLDAAVPAGGGERECTLFVEAPGGGDEPVRRRVHVRLRALGDGDGAARGWIVVLEDMTSLRRLERVRRDFVNNVSHELRTPVTAVSGYLDLLAAGGGTADERARFLAAARRNAQRLDRIIADLLLLADVESGERKPAPAAAPLRPILEAAGREVADRAAARNVRIAVECPEDLAAPVNGLLVEQAVINLLDNAVKYGPAGETVTVAAARGGDGAVTISVADRGAPVAPQHRDRLFERFYRVDAARSRETGGTGLGLAIVRHIAQLHGGTATLSPAADGGNVFAFTLAPPP